MRENNKYFKEVIELIKSKDKEILELKRKLIEKEETIVTKKLVNVVGDYFLNYHRYTKVSRGIRTHAPLDFRVISRSIF